MLTLYRSGGPQATAKALSCYNFPSDHSPYACVAGMRYLADRKLVPDVPTFGRKCSEIYNRAIRDGNIQVANEIRDIAHVVSPLLGALFMDAEEKGPAINTQNVMQKIVGDKQNVHNNQINEAVLKCTKYICEKNTMLNVYKTPEEKLGIFIEICRFLLGVKHTFDIDDLVFSLDFIQKNTATFTDKYFSLMDVFISVFVYITEEKDPEVKQELYGRLIEEITDAKDKCSTGYLSRIISAVQGFTDDPELTISVSDTFSLKLTIENFLTSSLSNAPEEIQEGLLDQTPEFMRFIRGKIAERLLAWEKEYGTEQLGNIAKYVNKYCMCTVFDSK